jgi:prevent-host-death family protein
MKNKGRQLARTSRWRFSEAKVRFDELFDLARSVGPQTVARKSKEAVVIISAEEYARLTRSNRSQTLIEFFAQSPLAKANLDLERTPDYGREVKLFSPRVGAKTRIT